MNITEMLKERGIRIHWGDSYLERDEDGTYNVYSPIEGKRMWYNRICCTLNEEHAVESLLEGVVYDELV